MAELFKFRCYQCQKLIGTPPSKFGKVVKCPRCEVELIVPSPDGGEGQFETEEANPDGFRPEDFGFKIEPERLSTPKPSPVSPVVEPVGSDPIAFLSQVAGSSEPANFEGPKEPSLGESSGNSPESDELPEPEVEPLVHRGRGRGTSARIEPLARSRDVVMPRTAVVAWSLFGIIGLGFAFTSGLLLGHFLWK